MAEAWTHADGAIGHFTIGDIGKADLSLLPDVNHFVVLEAKMFSKLSSGVTNAGYFDQAARNVGCIAETIKRAERDPSEISLGFYLLAPQSQIEQGVFKEMSCTSIKQKVERRVSEYGGEKEEWYCSWFLPTFQNIDIRPISWEELITDIGEQDLDSANDIGEFYKYCVEFN